MRYFELAGKSSPDSRLTSIRTNPSASDRRCFHRSARVSAHARDMFTFFLGGVDSAIGTGQGWDGKVSKRTRRWTGGLGLGTGTGNGEWGVVSRKSGPRQERCAFFLLPLPV